MERGHITCNCGFDHLFDPVIARDNLRVFSLHSGLRVRLILDPAAPVFGPCVKGIAVGELITRLLGPKGAERVGEIRAVRLHQAQQFIDQINICVNKLNPDLVSFNINTCAF